MTLATTQIAPQNSEEQITRNFGHLEARGYHIQRDDELMLLARQGNKAAFEAIVLRYQSQAIATAFKKVGDRGLACDIAQNTFVQLYAYVPRYRGQGHFSALLFRILFNECNKIYRSRFYANRYEEQSSHGSVECKNRPDDCLEISERRRDLSEELSKLSAKLRDALMLRFSDELSYNDISIRLEVPVGTVKSRIAAGKKQLREALGREWSYS